MTGYEIYRQGVDNGVHKYVRVRKSIWANPEAYARFSLVVVQGNLHVGPWMHLFDRWTQEAIGEPTPQALMLLLNGGQDAFLKEEWDLYEGPQDPRDI